MKRLAAGGHAVLVDVVERRSWSTIIGVEPHLMRHRPLLSRAAENRAASSPVQKSFPQTGFLTIHPTQRSPGWDQGSAQCRSIPYTKSH
jgi:hypothetical protein